MPITLEVMQSPIESVHHVNHAVFFPLRVQYVVLRRANESVLFRDHASGSGLQFSVIQPCIDNL